MKKILFLMTVILALVGCDKEDISLAGTYWQEQSAKDYYNELSFDSSTVCRMSFVSSTGASMLLATGTYVLEDGRVEFDMTEGEDFFGLETDYQYGIISGDVMEVFYLYGGTGTLHSKTFQNKTR